MRNKLLFRMWLSRLVQYLIIPTVLCVILLPLYNILHQQTIKAQLTDASEQLASSVSTFENYLYNIRYVTNKLFHDSSYNILAVSSDDYALGDNATGQTASRLLEDLTYSMSPVSYSYVTFARNQFVIDDCRAYRSYNSYYPGTLEYHGMSQEDWTAQLRQGKMSYLPAQEVVLYQTAYPDTYLTISQPFFDSYDRFMGSCTMLLREKQLINLFLPLEDWRSNCLFYIAGADGTILLHHHFDGALPLDNVSKDGPQVYGGQEYLFVSREISDLNATAVIGLPYEVYSDNLAPINRMIWLYIGTGLLASLALSIAMTVLDLRFMGPMMDALDNYEGMDRHLFYDMILQKLRTHNQLSIELERTRNQMEHGRIEALLKTGTANSPADHQLLCETLHLTDSNYLLLIPASTEPEAEGSEEFRLMLLAEQVCQCYGGHPFIHNAADGSVLVVLTLEQDTPEGYDRLCSQTQNLYTRLQTRQPLVLSGRFTNLEQLSSVYWQARNAAARADSEQQVYCLRDHALARTTVPEIATLERLNEYLLAGYTEKAQELILQIFGSQELSLESFQQIFYSVRGVLLTAAEKAACEDVTLTTPYDHRQPMGRQIRHLCDCCLIIGSHVDALKQSHNQQLQQSILQWLEENFYRPDLNLAMAAEQFHISKKYVSQFLKDQTGKSYNEYVEELRLSHAMTLLRESDLSVTEIAIQCGFSSQNTFYKAFRRRFDISPSSIRRDSGQYTR